MVALEGGLFLMSEAPLYMFDVETRFLVRAGPLLLQSLIAHSDSQPEASNG